MKTKMLFLVDAPGVDWLLLNVKTVTDWLFTAVVEQQAERFEEHPSKICLFSPLVHSISLGKIWSEAWRHIQVDNVPVARRKSMTEASTVVVCIIIIISW